jgi:hypothetical protein
MLRNDYIQNYKDKSPFEIDNKYAQDDDNYMLNSYRPLAEKHIQNLPQKYLQKFVDDVLINKKLSYVLYTTNAKSEIKAMIKSKEVLQKNSVKTKQKPIQNNPNNIVVTRKKKETIAMIKEEADNYKANKNNHKQILTTKH